MSVNKEEVEQIEVESPEAKEVLFREKSSISSLNELLA